MNQVISIATKEMLHIIRDKQQMIFLLIIPLVGAFLLAYLYTEERVMGLDLVIVDEDNSPLSRDIAFQYSQAESFAFNGYVASYDEATRLLQDARIDAAVIIPPNFSRDVKAGRPTQVLTLIDGTNMLISNMVLRASSQIVQTVSAGTMVKMLEANGIVPEKAKNILQSIGFSTRVWFNPTFNYRHFLLIGLIITLMQQVLLMTISTTFAREKQGRTNIYLATAPVSSLKVVAGKILPYFCFGLLNVFLLLVYSNQYIGIGIRGQGIYLLLLSVGFVLGLIGMALPISILATNELRATQVCVIIAMPSFLLSGYTWPIASMPWLGKFLANILPLTHYLAALKTVGVKGGVWSAALPEIGFLYTLAAGGIGGAVYLWQRQRSNGNLVLWNNNK
ncbi:MAG: ABC transporter permease [Heliobacteriaceae bacterium]|nr:ABC transporter permease [Heliobacteriaceae bacterium]